MRVLGLLAAALLSSNCASAQPRQTPHDFPFDQGLAVSAADKALRKYFTSETYSKRDYDQLNPLVGSFLGKDCGGRPLRLVLVAYRPADPNESLLAAILRAPSFELEAEGPAMSKDIGGIVNMFKDPQGSGQCHENE